VLANVGERCIVLKGNTHNLADLKVLEEHPRLLLGSAGQIGRGRHGAVIWDLAQPHPLAQRLAIRDQWASGGTVAISDDAKLVAAHWSGVLRLFNRISGRSTEFEFTEDVRQIRLAPDGSALALRSGDGRVWTVKSEDGLLKEPANLLPGPFQDMRYGPEGDLILLGESTIKRLPSGTEIPLPFSINDSRMCNFLGPFGALAVIEKEAAVETFDSTTGSHRRYALDRSGNSGERLCNHADLIAGRYIVRLIQTYEPNPIEVIDTRSGHITYLQNPFSRISGLPTDLMRVTAGDDGERFTVLSTVETDRVVFYEFKTGRISGELRAGKIVAFDIDAMGRTLVTLGEEGLLTWNVDTDQWESLTRALAGRSLTTDERLAYTE